ncbi:MAG: class I SAM-dependent methyltransferase, partial [Syntrophales bacterium]|nr:class I SAM-dependent methyltransferase [Syntrophales bacterium]
RDSFDADLLDVRTGKIDTLPFLRRTITDLSLEDTVIIIVATSTQAARFWRIPLGMVFIDGSHTFASVYGDYVSWSPHLLPGGLLVFHDLYEDPSQGGQAPFAVYQMALASGLFEELPRTGSLGVLKKVPPGLTTTTAETYRRRYVY